MCSNKPLLRSFFPTVHHPFLMFNPLNPSPVPFMAGDIILLLFQGVDSLPTPSFPTSSWMTFGVPPTYHCPPSPPGPVHPSLTYPPFLHVRLLCPFDEFNLFVAQFPNPQAVDLHPGFRHLPNVTNPRRLCDSLSALIPSPSDPLLIVLSIQWPSFRLLSPIFLFGVASGPSDSSGMPLPYAYGPLVTCSFAFSRIQNGTLVPTRRRPAGAALRAPAFPGLV